MMLKTTLLFAVGTLCLVRGLHNPVRALVRKGAIRRCEGPNSFGVCDPSIEVVTTAGDPAFATAAGKILAVGVDYVHILANDEPIILMYQGLQPKVRVGQYVSPGQDLGATTGTLYFSVTQMGPGGVRTVPPSAWLASRGCQVVVKNTGNNDPWCGKGRQIVVPKTTSACNFKLPEKAGFSLLPVSVEVNS